MCDSNEQMGKAMTLCSEGGGIHLRKAEGVSGQHPYTLKSIMILNQPQDSRNKRGFSDLTKLVRFPLWGGTKNGESLIRQMRQVS